MLNQELLDRFWKDFNVVTQEDDPEYPIANPQDAAKALIKCRNWVGVWTEQLVDTEQRRMNAKRGLESNTSILKDFRNEYLNELRPNFAATTLKVKELQDALIFERARENKLYQETLRTVTHYSDILDDLESDKELLEVILKRLEKSVDWLVQYLNWIKYELRGNNG
jgi:hypothetical protein